MSEMSERLAKSARVGMMHRVLNQSPRSVADAALRESLAACLRELAEYGDEVEFALNPSGYLFELADEIHPKGEPA